MRVTISSSSNDLIDDKYKNSSIKVCDFLAEKGFDLNWGSGSTSIMGICYDEFEKNNRTIYGYTTSKYVDQIDDLPNATHKIYDTTFELKQNIFEDADIVIILPGGTGSISEFFAYLEESRSNDKNTEIIVYNEDNHYDTTLKLIDDLVKRNFNANSIYDYFKVADSFEDFVNIIEEFLNNRGR